jgi:hypothetical protein
MPGGSSSGVPLYGCAGAPALLASATAGAP